MKKPFILQVVGYKNTGKTTLICSWLEFLKQQGCRIGTIKHDAHDFSIDHEGTDTWKHQQAGAAAVAITSPNRTAIIQAAETSLNDLIQAMRDMDVVLVEGFKLAAYPKVVLVKSEADLSLIHELQQIIAIMTWIPIEIKSDLPIFSIEDAASQKKWLVETLWPKNL